MSGEQQQASRWNVKRGVNRLFTVFALCWYIGSGINLWNSWAPAIKAERDAAAAFDPDAKLPEPPPGYKIDPPKKPDVFDQIALDRARESRPLGLTMTLLLVPPAAYGFAASLWWVARGFRGAG